MLGSLGGSGEGIPVWCELADRPLVPYNGAMRRRRQLLPTLVILAGAGVLLAGVYREVPAWLGVGGLALLSAGGVWALRRSGLQRREAAETYWNTFDGAPPTFGDVSSGHHHGGHHGGFDGGGFFDGGGGGHGGGHGGH
jgi:hypothetical protein